MQFSLKRMMLAVACFAVALAIIALPEAGGDGEYVELWILRCVCEGIAFGTGIGTLAGRPIVGAIIGGMLPISFFSFLIITVGPPMSK